MTKGRPPPAPPDASAAPPRQKSPFDEPTSRLSSPGDTRALFDLTGVHQVTQISRISRETIPERPLLSPELKVVAEKGDLVTVERPDGRSFPIYAMEWKLAQLFDGSRNIDDVVAAARRAGLDSKRNHVTAFVRELRGYQFLADPPERTVLHYPRVADALVEALSDEERDLLHVAAQLEARNDARVIDYLNVVLQVNPRNAAALRARDYIAAQPRRNQTVVEDDIADVLRDAAPGQLLGERTVTVAASELRSRVRRRTEEPPLGGDDDVVHGAVQPGRSTVVEPRGTVMEPRGPRLRVVVIGVVIAFAIVVPLVAWIAVRIASRAMLAELQNGRVVPSAPGGTPAPGDPPTQVAAQTEVIVRAELAAEASTDVTAPVAGILAATKVRVGERVEADAPIAELMSAKDYATYARAQKRLQRAEARAKYDEVYRYFLSEARNDFEAATRGLKRSVVSAPSAGVVLAAEPAPGQPVEAGARLATIASDRELSTTLPSSDLPFQASLASCRVETAPGAGCRVAVTDANALKVIVDNGQGVLEAGRPVTIRIRQGR